MQTRDTWHQHLKNLADPLFNPSPQYEATTVKRLRHLRLTLNRRLKAYERHISQYPIDHEKVLAKIKEKTEYTQARNAEKEATLSRIDELHKSIRERMDKIREEMHEEHTRWAHEDAKTAPSPSTVAYRGIKTCEF